MIVIGFSLTYKIAIHFGEKKSEKEKKDDRLGILIFFYPL